MPETTSVQEVLSRRYVDAFQLAFDVHSHQLRKATSVPYLSHVMSVSALVLEAGGGEDCALGGLLHDAVEDSPDGAAMLQRIHGQFGTRVATIVESCSDTVPTPGTEKPPWRGRKEAYIAHLRDADPDSLLVSACDKLHNARSIVADLRQVGPDLWQRFSTGSGSDQVWYYQSLCDAFASRIPTALAAALGDVVREMTTLASAQGVATTEQVAWLSSRT